MEFETLLLAAIQSSFLLGLLHGVNPCGHSWLVLAPFVTGEKNGGRVVLLTCAFLGGTALACLALGASLGAVSQVVPAYMGTWVEGGTSAILVVLGLILIYNPHILHNHRHDHDHGDDEHDVPGHSHGPEHNGHYCRTSHVHNTPRSLRLFNKTVSKTAWLPIALFGIGFVNMIVPCPTAAVMYGYALNAGSTMGATLVFGTYAFSTAIAVGAVIFFIYTATSMANSLQKEWIEPLIMRLSGVVIVVFSIYSLYQFSV